MTSKTVVQANLKNQYSSCDIRISPDNRVEDLSCLVLTNVTLTEKVLNIMGYTIIGICSDVPTAISLGMNDVRLLIVKSTKTGELYWLSCFDYIIENWLEG